MPPSLYFLNHHTRLQDKNYSFSDNSCGTEVIIAAPPSAGPAVLGTGVNRGSERGE
jgi:hypothetical protein